MRRHQSMYATASVAMSVLLVLCGRAAAEGFNPQPEPPGSWYVDGEYTADLQFFQVQIGDTNWDETMPNTGILLEVTGGVVSGMGGNMTCTVPVHPDLEFWLPTSPGAWEARDERSDRDEVDLGLIRGTYALRDGVVPEPSSLTLLCIGTFSLLAFCRRRRK